MSTVYMICGNTGAGKSTYANQLAHLQNAVVFSLDPWMQSLFYDDYNPGIHDFNWITERTERCKKHIYQTAERLISLNIDVILDLGFPDAKSRYFCKEWAASLGAKPTLHYLDVSASERKKRVHQRNKDKGSTFAFEVTDEMFDYVDPFFEAPTDAECIKIRLQEASLLQ